MVDKATATVQMDRNGRLYIPAGARKALDIYEKSATLKLDIEVLERKKGGENEEGE